jgi:hypothetical protein
MAAKCFRSDHRAAIDALLLTIPGVTSGVIFGLPCYKIDGAVFATLFGDGVGLKLPAAHVSDLLAQPGFAPFRPFGKSRGDEFVQRNHDDSHDYRHDLDLFDESMAYVTALAHTRGRR